MTCDIAEAIDVLTSFYGCKVCIWPWFSWAGKSQRLDDLWARYRDTRLRAGIPDSVEDFVNSYYRGREDEKPVFVLQQSGSFALGFEKEWARSHFEHICNSVKRMGEYKKGDILANPDGSRTRGPGYYLGVSKFSDLRLKPFAQARAALGRAIASNEDLDS